MSSKPHFFKSEKALNEWVVTYLIQKKEKGPVIFLDSQLEGHPASHNGYIATDPVSVLSIEMDKVTISFDETLFKCQILKNELLMAFPFLDIIEENACSSLYGNTSFCFSRQHINAWELLDWYRRHVDNWLFGWLSYDLKNDVENLVSCKKDPVRLPDLHFFVPGSLLYVNRSKKETRVIQGEREGLDFDAVPEPVSLEPFKLLRALTSGDGWEMYKSNVEQVKAFIEKGDTYEVNLTHQLSAPCKGDPLYLFERMRQGGPVPFASCIHMAGVDICCASPERFLKKEKREICSQPIKGTAPRGRNAQEDDRIINQILNKEKNIAENVMIVDLVRNDLARIAEKGTVQVTSLTGVQTFATVHQLVSEVSAILKPNTSAIEAIKHCFPMGSMTGAPKIRTMEIIEELESYRRGIYSGAIGYFAPNGDFDFNVVIRTAIVKDGFLYYSVGGAITADSCPEDEWNESWLKSKALTCGEDGEQPL